MKMHWSLGLNVQKIAKALNMSAIAMSTGKSINKFYEMVLTLISVRSSVGLIKKLVLGKKFKILHVQKI